MLLSTTSYCNNSVVDSLNPLVILTFVTSYFNKLVNLRSYYSIIIELNLKIILPHQLPTSNNRLLYTYWKIGLTKKKTLSLGTFIQRRKKLWIWWLNALICLAQDRKVNNKLVLKFHHLTILQMLQMWILFFYSCMPFVLMNVNVGQLEEK